MSITVLNTRLGRAWFRPYPHGGIWPLRLVRDRLNRRFGRLCTEAEWAYMHGGGREYRRYVRRANRTATVGLFLRMWLAY